LETLDQYLKHRIEPPKSLSEMRDEYLRIVAQEAAQFRDKVDEKVQRVLNLWKRRGKFFLLPITRNTLGSFLVE
jgi:hypothetical protein